MSITANQLREDLQLIAQVGLAENSDGNQFHREQTRQLSLISSSFDASKKHFLKLKKIARSPSFSLFPQRGLSDEDMVGEIIKEIDELIDATEDFKLNINGLAGLLDSIKEEDEKKHPFKVIDGGNSNKAAVGEIVDIIKVLDDTKLNNAVVDYERFASELKKGMTQMSMIGPMIATFRERLEKTPNKNISKEMKMKTGLVSSSTGEIGMHFSDAYMQLVSIPLVETLKHYADYFHRMTYVGELLKKEKNDRNMGR